MKNYDVIVVGAGNGGLSAAAFLAKAGKKVLVLEKHNLPGGCATSFRRGRFEFEATLHEMCQMGEGEHAGAIRQLLDGYGLEVDWVSIDEAFCSINTAKENGFWVSMPVGVQNFLDEMERQVPGCRSSMETVMEMSRMITDGVNWLASKNNEPTGLSKIKMVLSYGDLMKMVPVTTDDMLRRIGVPDKAREIYESYWDYVAVDSTKMSFAVYAFMTYTYLTKKPYIAKHRSHEISMAFDDAITKAGGEIWYNCPVKKLLIEQGSVKGVALENGQTIPCDRVIANLMPTVVFDRMVDPDSIPERDRKSMNARKLAQAAFTVYLGLDASAKELGLKGYDTFIRSTGDTLEQYNNAASMDTHKDYCATIINEAIPDASEKGTCFLQFAKFYTEDVFADVTEKEYFALKDQIADEMITHYEKLYNVDLRSHIEEIVIATPVTWARYLGTPQGDVYGYAPETWDGMFPRVQSGHKVDYTIKGLRFCGGHGTQMDGYSQAYASGAEQARYTLQDMKEGN